MSETTIHATVDDVLLDVLALPGWLLHPDGDLSRFARRHIGIACKLHWHELCGYLSRGVTSLPGVSDPEVAKRQEGGWAGGLYQGNWRNGTAFVHTQLLTLDFDGHGDVARAAEALSAFRCAIHSTYKSTLEKPRCRAVMLLSEVCTNLREYKRAHVAMRDALYRDGYVRPDKKAGIEGDVDEGASDATRLNFAPMHHPDRAFHFATTAGEPLEIARIPLPHPRAITIASARTANRDRYREGALRRAAHEVRTALPGQRHNAAFREAAALARPELGLADEEIFETVLPAFIAAAGEGRAGEGEHTIADAIRRGREGR